ncbi:type IV toxin-antitoxin system AbiEi family antitoxin domain-containing protein, partial [Microbacterium sp.]|uniref:type IV toxin-antitoxin system AbiEi family antitoxin domain-containing protein n=1 Tax=Microbacterium sp. TaxID=51671 RepID=UPI002E338A40
MRLSADRIAYGVELARAAGGGILLHRDLLSGGLSTAAIHRLVSDGALVRLRRGAYTTPDAAAERDARYRLFVLASMALGDVDRVAGLWSAAALHRLPLIGAWP